MIPLTSNHVMHSNQVPNNKNSRIETLSKPRKWSLPKLNPPTSSLTSPHRWSSSQTMRSSKANVVHRAKHPRLKLNSFAITSNAQRNSHLHNDLLNIWRQSILWEANAKFATKHFPMTKDLNNILSLMTMRNNFSAHSKAATSLITHKSDSRSIWGPTQEKSLFNVNYVICNSQKKVD